MSTTITHGLTRRSLPRLRLLRDEGQPRPLQHQAASHHAASQAEPHRDEPASAAPRPEERRFNEGFVLVVGGDASNRARIREQLRALFPQDTAFAEADETWEVVAQAGHSRMVVLTGDLGDLTARGLMRVLSRRHPLLPVIALGDRAHGAAPKIGAVSL